MLARAREAATEQDVKNVTWVLGADTDIPAVASLLGGNQVGSVTVGQALHWMRYHELFHALIPMFRPGGGIAIVTNGTPMWLQDSSWSRALRGFLEEWSGATLTATCGTDDASQQRYRDAMTGAGFDVTEIIHSYTDELDLDHMVGGIYSALGAQKLPSPDQRADFAAGIGRAVAPHAPFIEHVPVRILAGRTRAVLPDSRLISGLVFYRRVQGEEGRDGLADRGTPPEGGRRAGRGRPAAQPGGGASGDLARAEEQASRL